MFNTLPTKLIGLAFLVLWSMVMIQFSEAAEPGTFTKNEAYQKIEQTGKAQLFLDGGQNRFFAAEGIAAHADVSISGLMSEVTLYQIFHNTSNKWVEGFYVYPLPENSAVDAMEMIIADRVIKGEIKEKTEAKKIYEQAKSDGKAASLISSKRPNVFSTSVANIGPNQRIVVKIGMKFRNRYDSGTWSFRMPLVVAPRYGNAEGGNQSLNLASPENDKGVNSQTANPAKGLELNPFSLSIDLDAGLPISKVSSLSHQINLSGEEPNFRQIELSQDSTPADRDFVLEWTTEEAAGPQLAVFKEKRGTQVHVSALVVPPLERPKNLTVLPRDLIIILDTSGSMDGPSIEQAKQALHFTLDRLTAQDRFNVIAFDSTTSAAFPVSQSVDETSMAIAKNFVDIQVADGGTEMMPALGLALAEQPTEGRMRQIVFITDGAVGYEGQVLAKLSSQLGRNRVFTVGIGSAPNTHFMTKLAEFGRGTYSYISDVNQVKTQMATLMTKLETPLLTDVKITYSTGTVDRQLFPNPLPDLYFGEPVEFNLRFDSFEALEDPITLKGNFNGETWAQPLDLANAEDRAGVAALWARAKVEQLEAQRLSGKDPAVIRKAVLDVALNYSLVTAYTSLVAVEQERSRPAGEPINFEHLAANLPAGWSFEKVFGDPVLYDQSPTQHTEETPEEAKAKKIALPKGGLATNILIILALLSLLGSLWLFRPTDKLKAV